MPEHTDPSARYRLWPLDRRVASGLAATGLIAAGIVGAFAYTGGFLSPGRLTQARMIDRFERVNGVNPGFRRNHAKGVCITGSFDSNGNGARLSKAAVFAPGRTPVTGRFAVAVGKPFVPDSETEVRSMALSLRPSGGEEWRTGMNDIPVFPVSTPAAFYDLLLAGSPDPATGKPDPAKFQAFLATYPESGKALQAIKSKPFSSGFGDASYNSLDAFYFVNAAGVSTPVRWSMIAVDPFVAQAPAAAAPDKNYLFEAFAARLAKGPAQWHLVVTVGQAGDATNDAALAWPDDREHVDVGMLTIDRMEPEGPGNCRDVNYDPLVLPSGIAPSDDPLLSARSAAYSTSYTRRAGESKTPSEVQVSASPKGM